MVLKSHQVRVRIDERAAQTVVEQVFRNPNDFPVEGVYLFPLPRGAAISSFSLYVDGKKVKAELLDRGKARGIYLDYVRRMIDPGLLEYVGRGLIRLRLFPLPARGERKIRLEYAQILEFDAGTVRYAYPFTLQRLSRRTVKQAVLTAEIRSQQGVQNVYSPSHPVRVVRKSDRHLTVSFEQDDAKLDRDFLLYYTLSAKDVGLTVLTHRPKGEDGYFLALLSPKYARAKTQSLPKDVTFVLDTSGSMNGEKIRQAKEALLYCVGTLNPADRFRLIRFSSEVESFRKGLLSASAENVKAAREFISDLRARGGTNINEALLTALGNGSGGSDSGRPRMVIFLTDGQPTVGVRDPAEILRNVRRNNSGGRRVFVFGVGYRVNTHLLDKLSGQNGGTSDYVTPGENIEVKVSSFFRKVSEPVLANLSLDWGGLETAEVYPPALPDLFRGSQIVLMGRYKSGGSKRVELAGHVNGKRQTFAFDVRFPEEASGNDFLPRLWAHRKVGFLLDEIRLNGENKELKDEVIRLAKKFGLMTPYTSFLAMEDRARVARRRPPPGSPAFRLHGPAPSPPAASFRQKTGKAAVSMSKALQAQKEALRAPQAKQSGLRWVEGKVFRLKKGFWVDEAYKPGGKTVSVRFASPEYFDLIRKDPKVAKYLALGKKVIFCLDGKCYRIEAEKA